MKQWMQPPPTVHHWRGITFLYSQDTEKFDFVPLQKDQKHMFTSDQKWSIVLLKLLDDMNAPDYAFEAINEWVRAAKADNYLFYPQGGLSRSKNVDVLFQSMNNAKQLLPSVQPVPTQNKTSSDVIGFDISPQLLRLLQNCRMMIQDNLVLDMQNPLQQYKKPNGNIGEPLSRSVYQEAYSKTSYTQNGNCLFPLFSGLIAHP